MNPFNRRNYFSRFSTLFLVVAGCTVGGALPPAQGAPAQNPDVAAMRELRIDCLESINNAQARLNDLHGFVAEQVRRERAASDRLFALQQSAAFAKRRNVELQDEVRRSTNRLARAQSAVEQAGRSYRAAIETMPTGDDWAREGSSALSDLRRAADAAPQDVWKHKRFKEVQATFIETLQQWRTARRSMDQASFELEMKASPATFERTSAQIKTASKELKELEDQLAGRQAALDKLTSQSKQWGAAMRSLREEEAKSREELRNVRFKFHLVDLTFAAWRLKNSDVSDEDVEVLPDALEQSLEEEAIKDSGMVTPLSGAAMNDFGPGGLAGSETLSRQAGEREERSDNADPAFQRLLARVLLAQGRLGFLATVLAREFNSVQSAVGAVEAIEEQTRQLAAATGRLAADQENLRRSYETEQQTLTKGTETLDLVKQRFAADHRAITQLLSTATERTEALAKRLGKS